MIVSSFRAVPYSQMYYRELEKCKVQSLARSGGNFDRKAHISEEVANKWYCIEIPLGKWNCIENKCHIKFP